MPGYRGHVPTMKFDYGETYGNHTAKYFQDFRSSALDQSKSNYCKGGYFPTYYSHNPDIAIGQRTRQWDRWLQEPRYTVHPHDHDRREELTNFHRKSQAHRTHYQDKSGEAHRVDYFVLPTKAEDQFKKHVPFTVRTLRYTDDMKLDAPASAPVRTRHSTQTFRADSSQRDRQMRDVYFEQR